MYFNLNEIILYFKYNTKVRIREMYFFIAIILIAELIIAINLICLIIKLDKRVLAFSENLTVNHEKIKDGLKIFKTGVEKLVSGVHSLCTYARVKKQQYTISIVRTILLYALLFVLKGKSKKCVSALQLAAILKDCCESCN